MKKTEYEKLIVQNNERIEKKETQIKQLQADIKELKAKNEQLQDSMMLSEIKDNDIDYKNIIALNKLIKEQGLTENQINEMLSKGGNKNEL